MSSLRGRPTGGSVHRGTPRRVGAWFRWQLAAPHARVHHHDSHERSRGQSLLKAVVYIALNEQLGGQERSPHVQELCGLLLEDVNCFSNV